MPASFNEATPPLQRKGRPAPVTDLRAQLQRLRIIQSLRFTVYSAAVLVAAALTGMSTGIATLVPGIMLVLFLRDESLVASLALLAGVLFGAAVVLLNSYFWAQTPLLFLIFSLIAILGLAYWAAQGIRGRWPYLPFPIAAQLCLLSAVFAEISGAADGVEAAYVWVKEMPVGIVVFWIVLIGLWPSPKASDLDGLVQAARSECATLLRQTIPPVAKGLSTAFIPSPVSLKFFSDLMQTVDRSAGMLRTAPHDRGFLVARLHVLSAIYTNIRFMQRTFEDLPEPGLSPQARAAAADIMSALSNRIEDAPADDTTDAIVTIRREEQRHAADAARNLSSQRLAAHLSGFVVAAEALGQDIAGFDNPDSRSPPVSDPKTEADPAPPLMIDSLQSAIKIVIGVLVGLLVFMMTDLPASSYLVIIILIVLVQPNLGRAHLRVRLWFPGVLAGSLWAMAGLTVLSVLPHFGVYLVWFLPGLFLAGYFGTGPDRVSYVGIQIAAAMTTILGMAAYPVNNVISADARVVGAVVGFVIALAIYHFIWPIHPATLLRTNLVRNLRDISAVLERLCDTEAAERDAGKEAGLTGQVTALKLQIQADFGLLYDISYLISPRLRPAYDYHSLTRWSGQIYQQIWCLHEALSAIDDLERRRTIVAPIVAARKPLSAVLDRLADDLDKCRSMNARTMEQPIHAVRLQLRAALGEVAADTDVRRQQDIEYGLNSVGMMLYYLDRFADAMDLAAARRPLRTAELAQLYEAADR